MDAPGDMHLLAGHDQVPEVVSLAVNWGSSLAAAVCKDGTTLVLGSPVGRAQLAGIDGRDSDKVRAGAGHGAVPSNQVHSVLQCCYPQRAAAGSS
jgi:hypothetical protein